MNDLIIRTLLLVRKPVICYGRMVQMTEQKKKCRKENISKYKNTQNEYCEKE